MAEPISINIDLPTQEILLAASQHDIETLRSLIATYATTFEDRRAVDVQDPETLFTPLHAAIAACETEDDPDDGMASAEQELEEARATVSFLLEEGAIWNQLDTNNETPGCVALRLGLTELYQLMVDAGVRAELLLNRLEGGGYEVLEDEEEENADVPEEAEPTTNGDAVLTNGDGLDHPQDVTSQQYLSSALSLSGDRLLDEQQNGVMMAWEKDIMHKSADAILYEGCLRVLNIGFGMGIIDSYIQSHSNRPVQHHIIEAHPDVLADMKAKGWYENDGVTIHEGKWQDILPMLAAEGTMFDAIFFDTFAESYADFREFFSEQVIGLLEQGGKWSYFNGMGADRQISYDVYQKVVEMDLFEAGFDVDWQELDVPELEGEWEGVRRSYFNIKQYRLPVCRFMD
jgi:type IV protein arginine methyltransferase